MFNPTNPNHKEVIKEILYKNMSYDNSIEKILEFELAHRFGSKLPPDSQKCINVTPDSKLTTDCKYQYSGSFLDFDSINWKNIIVLDIKSRAFNFPFLAQKVLDKVIHNSNKRIFIHLCLGEKTPIQKIFDYFNQIKPPNLKSIYLEYLIVDGKIEYKESLLNGDMKTDIFSDVEIWTESLDETKCIHEKLI